MMEKSIIYACNECVQYFNHKSQLVVHKEYKHRKGASMSSQSGTSDELATEKPGSRDINLPENSILAQGNNMKVVSTTVMELDNKNFQQMSEIPLKLAQKSCGDPPKPTITNYAVSDSELSLECGKNDFGLNQKKIKEEPTIGCFTTTGPPFKNKHSKSVKRKLDESEIGQEPQKTLRKSPTPSGFSVTSPEGSSDQAATLSQNSTKTQPNKFERNSREGIHCCNYCEYRSKYRNNLRTHQLIHTGEKPYKCGYCSYSTTQPSALQRHERTHTGEKPFKCKHCSYRAADRACVRRHERTHTGEKPYKCSYCSYSAASLTSLRAHERTHTGERPYQCLHCGYNASQLSCLRSHERIHTGEKPYQCQHCNYSSATVDNLRNHELIHTKEQ